MTTKAAVLTAFREPLQIREYPAPPGPGPGEAVVRVEMAGICCTDVHLWLGQLPIPLPVILGHETAGRLEQLGAFKPSYRSVGSYYFLSLGAICRSEYGYLCFGDRSGCDLKCPRQWGTGCL